MNSVVSITLSCVVSIARLTRCTFSWAISAVSSASAIMPRTSSLISAVDSARCMVAVDRWPDMTLNCSAICRPWTAIAVPCSLSAVALVIKGSSRSSSRLTDLTARLTNVAIAIIAAAIIRKDKAMIAVMITSQNNGSCGFILSENTDRGLGALYFGFVCRSQHRPRIKGDRGQSPKHQVRLGLHCLFRRVSRSGLGTAGKLGLAFLFHVGFLSRFDRCGDRTCLTRSGIACLRGDFARLRSNFTRLSRGGVVKFSSPLTRGFYILARRLACGFIIFTRPGARSIVVFGCSRAHLLGGFPRFVDAFASGVGDVVAQFLSRFRGEQQSQYRAHARADQKER